MKTVGMVTTARSDWGIQRSVAAAIKSHPELDLKIIAGGMHLVKEFGRTVEQIRADGFEPAYELDYVGSGDGPSDVAASIGRGVQRFGELFAGWRPDVLTVLGDRFDMLPAAIAASPYLLPIAHLHGGEVTYGAIDDAYRHALTKLSHLHLCSTEAYARRIAQLGEEDNRIHVVGAPGLDDLMAIEPLAPDTLADRFGFLHDQTNMLVVYHPETLDYQQAGPDAGELIAALESFDANVVILRPNADTARQSIDRVIDAYAEGRDRTMVAVHLERRAFLSLMRAASVMIGNSSSGIIEAPSFGVPVVNVGRRQDGRIRGSNAIDCPPRRAAIQNGIRTALSDAFRAEATGALNPYGDGQSGPRVAEILAKAPVGKALIQKRFVDRG